MTADVYLQPGDVHVSSGPATVQTVLGSCVSVCVFGGGAGGINHYLLPRAPASAPASPRYGNVAIAEVLARLDALGISRSALRAKLFGGASPAGMGGALASGNVQVAVDALQAEGIPIVARDVGGVRGRSVRFQPATGLAWVKEL